ncbi:MAG TPA: hypothetical protein VFE20_03385 [Thermoleophilia bacterium]|nr:hypothetical protein [Thermoleophilia bacterium]
MPQPGDCRLPWVQHPSQGRFDSRTVAGWVSTTWEELESAVGSKLAVPPEERDDQAAQTVYRAIVRSYLLDVFNARWWVANLV